MTRSAVAKFKIRQYVLGSDSPNSMPAKVSRYTVYHRYTCFRILRDPIDVTVSIKFDNYFAHWRQKHPHGGRYPYTNTQGAIHVYSVPRIKMHYICILELCMCIMPQLRSSYIVNPHRLRLASHQLAVALRLFLQLCGQRPNAAGLTPYWGPIRTVVYS